MLLSDILSLVRYEIQVVSEQRRDSEGGGFVEIWRVQIVPDPPSSPVLV